MLKSVLITGGGSGIGAALAVTLANCGCQVLISGRRTELLEAVAKRSDKITACPSDVTQASDQSQLAQSLAGLPAPRGLFHGAGHFQLGKLHELSAADWQSSFDTNVTARWALSLRCADHLDSGRMLFIGSDSARNIREGAAAYSIAQAASETLRRALQAEWADRDIAISAFKPGLVDTDMVRNFLAVSEQEFPAKTAFQNYLDRGEFVTAQTVAAFAAWLLLKVEAGKFESTEWDLRDTNHHAEWKRD